MPTPPGPKPKPPSRPPEPTRPPTKPVDRPPHRVVTAGEAFAAGWEDGADDEPLTQDEITRLVALHAPYLRPVVPA